MAISGDDRQSDKISEKFTQALNLAATAKRGLADNKAKLIGLANRAKTIKNPTARAKIEAQIKQHLAQHVAVQNFYNDASRKLAEFNAFLKNLMAQAMSTVGLGFLPAIPAAWVAVLVAAGVALTAVITANNLHAGAIGETNRVVDSMLKGQITPEAAEKAIHALNDQVAGQQDMLGIKSAVTAAAKIAVPALLIVAAIFVLPQVLSTARTLAPRRAA